MAPRRTEAPPVPAIAVVGAEVVEVDRLRPMSGNPRRTEESVLDDSLAAYGQFRGVVVNRPSMTVVAGHHVLERMQQRGATQVFVEYVEVDDETARRMAAADNRVADLSSYDTDALAAFLGSLDDLAGTGYDLADVEAMRIESEQSQLREVMSAGATASPAGNGERPVIVGAMIAVPDVGVVEEALAQTGARSRGEALVAVCRSYLEQR